MSKTTDNVQPKGADKGQAPKDPAGRVITLLIDYNPRRPNTQTYERFKLYRSGMTVGDFLKAGGTPRDIAWDIQHAYIEVSEAA